MQLKLWNFMNFEGYEFLSFAKNMSKNIGKIGAKNSDKNICKKIRGKYS